MSPSARGRDAREERVQKGDILYRKGRRCQVVKVDYTVDPPSLIVRMEDTNDEVGTELNLLTRTACVADPNARRSIAEDATRRSGSGIYRSAQPIVHQQSSPQSVTAVGARHDGGFLDRRVTSASQKVPPATPCVGASRSAQAGAMMSPALDRRRRTYATAPLDAEYARASSTAVQSPARKTTKKTATDALRSAEIERSSVRSVDDMLRNLSDNADEMDDVKPHGCHERCQECIDAYSENERRFIERVKRKERRKEPRYADYV